MDSTLVDSDVLPWANTGIRAPRIKSHKHTASPETNYQVEDTHVLPLLVQLELGLSAHLMSLLIHQLAPQYPLLLARLPWPP